MAWVRIVCDGAKLFGRKLLITEMALLGLGALLFPLLAFWLGGDSGGMIELLTNSWLQRQALLIVTLFVAPLFALAQTLWEMMDT
jgi:membrane protein implicated in regulation of membrane protease activity